MWATEGLGGFAFLKGRQTEMFTGPLAPASGGTAHVMTSSYHQPVLVISDYAQALQFLTDSRLSRAALGSHGMIGPASAMSITNMDPPRHTRVRGLFGRAFSARSVKRLRPRIYRRAIDLSAGIRTDGLPVDLVATFCAPFAFGVHCDLLGVPEEFRAAILSWSLARSSRPGATPPEVYAAETGLHRVLTDVLEHLRHHGSAGLLGDLLAARDRDELTAAELTGLASSLFFDGHILATSQIALAALCLIHHRDQATLLASDSSRLGRAVEELLRFSPSITVGMPRIARASTNLGGLRLRPGMVAAVAFGLVNRDPVTFDTPHQFDVTRATNRHLSFGRGAHYCLGAHLMRMELQVTLDVLGHHLSNLAADDERLAWTASHTIRSLKTLPLTRIPPQRVAGSHFALA